MPYCNVKLELTCTGAIPYPSIEQTSVVFLIGYKDCFYGLHTVALDDIGSN